MIINMVIAIYTSRVVLDVLGVDDYGIYNVVGGFVAMLAIITSSLTSAATRFITVGIGEGNSEKLGRIYSMLILIFGVISFLILLFGEIFGIFFLDEYLIIPENRLNSAHIVFHCSVLAFITNLLSIPNTAIITAHEKMDFLAFISICQSFLKLLIVLLLYYYPYDRLIVYAILLLVVEILVRILYGVYCTLHFRESRFKFVWDVLLLKRIFGYSIWASVGSSSSIIKSQGVNVLINMFFGVAMNAARGISMQIFSLINQFSRSVGMAISPQIMKSFARGERSRAFNLTLLQGKAQGIMILFIALPILLETDYILELWLKEVPVYASIFTKWVVILVFAQTLQNTHTPVFLANGNIMLLEIIAGGLMMLNLPISYCFLKLGYPPYVTVQIGIVIEIICTIIIFSYLKHLISFPMEKFFKDVYIPLIIVSWCVYIILFYIRKYMEPCFLRLLLVITISVFSTLLFSYLIVFSRHERNIVLHLCRRVIIKKD